MLLHNKKCLKRPFRGVLAKKVTSTTPLNIGFYIGIIEFFRKHWTFLLNKLKIRTIFPFISTWGYYINYNWSVLLGFSNIFRSCRLIWTIWVLIKPWICRTLFVDKGFLDLSFCRPKRHRQKIDKKAYTTIQYTTVYYIYNIILLLYSIILFLTERWKGGNR